MRSIFYIQIKLLSRHWRALLALLMTPMLVLSGIGLICFHMLKEENPVQPFAVAIVDRDGSEETNLVIQHLLESDHITKLIDFQIVDEAEANDLFVKDEITSIILIPEHFSDLVRQGVNEPVTVIGNPNRPVQSVLMYNLMDSATRFTSAAQSAINTIYYFLTENGVSQDTIKENYTKSILHFGLRTLARGDYFEEMELEVFHQSHFLQYYSSSFYILILFVWAIGIVLLLKQRGSLPLINRLYSLGIRKGTIYGANTIVLFVALIIAGIPLFLPIYFLFDLEIYRFFVVLIIILSITAFMMFLDSVFVSEKNFLLAGILLMMIGAFCGGQIIPSIYLPEWINNIGYLTLNYWFLELITETGLEGQLQNLLCLGFCAIAFIFTGLLFHFWRDRRQGMA